MNHKMEFCIAEPLHRSGRTETLIHDENGIMSMVRYDIFCEWMELIKEKFNLCSEVDNNPLYVGGYEDTKLPFKLFDQANEEEKRSIFSSLLLAFIEARRDVVFEQRGQKRYEQIVRELTGKDNA